MRLSLRAALHPSRSQSGQALVELALLSTVLVLMLMAAIDYGRYFYDGILLGNAAQAGVQYGAHDDATDNDIAGMQAAATTDASGLSVAAAASNFCTCSDGTASGTTIACSTTTCPTGQHRLIFVKVVTTGSYSPLLAYPGIPASISLSRTAVMQVSP